MGSCTNVISNKQLRAGVGMYIIVQKQVFQHTFQLTVMIQLASADAPNIKNDSRNYWRPSYVRCFSKVGLVVKTAFISSFRCSVYCSSTWSDKYSKLTFILATLPSVEDRKELSWVSQFILELNNKKTDGKTCVDRAEWLVSPMFRSKYSPMLEFDLALYFKTESPVLPVALTLH